MEKSQCFLSPAIDLLTPLGHIFFSWKFENTLNISTDKVLRGGNILKAQAPPAEVKICSVLVVSCAYYTITDFYQRRFRSVEHLPHTYLPPIITWNIDIRTVVVLPAQANFCWFMHILSLLGRQRNEIIIRNINIWNWNSPSPSIKTNPDTKLYFYCLVHI